MPYCVPLQILKVWYQNSYSLVMKQKEGGLILTPFCT